MVKHIAGGTRSTQALSRLLLSLGLYGVVLGEALWLALLVWPNVLQNDVFMWPFFLATGIVLLASVLILVSLPGQQVHWLLAVGTLLVSLLAAFGQGWLFPNDPTYGTAYWFLTFGGAVVVLSLVLLGRVHGAWHALWRTLLVAGVGAAIPIAFLFMRGPADWEAPLYGLDFEFVSLVFGLLILITGFRLHRTTGDGAR